MNDSFYKHMRQWDMYTKLKKRVGHLDGVTSTLGKTGLDKYKLNKIFQKRQLDPQGEEAVERNKIIKEEELAQRQYATQMEESKRGRYKSSVSIKGLHYTEPSHKLETNNLVEPKKVSISFLPYLETNRKLPRADGAHDLNFSPPKHFQSTFADHNRENLHVTSYIN